ncbi:MAG: hypothetical protein QOC94_1133, partial [Actinoplanes sp.]|nr:hypothetical protein [Actinoplanes sp.]
GPTAKPPGKSCVEVVTVYGPAPQLWAWDWCDPKPRTRKVIKVDAKFVSTYTTNVNGHPAYAFDENLTNASTNQWTVYLFNYSTGSWDAFYTSAPNQTNVAGINGWNIFEVFTTLDPATGNGYYCPDIRNTTFESSNVMLHIDGKWTGATQSGWAGFSKGSASDLGFKCPNLKFTVTDQGDGWIARQ